MPDPTRPTRDASEGDAGSLVTFPRPRPAGRPSDNLPLQLTSFVGREREMAEVKRLLADQRLLTLTGPGGCGKTRLALAAVHELVEEFNDGVWLVELASLSDAALVAQTVAFTLGVREQPGRPLTETLTDYLRPREVLVVLDNTIQCTGGECDGTERSDAINGSDAQDLINALAGDDTTSGGVDTIIGGSGNDALSGGPADDFVGGGPGNDKLSGDTGNDQLDARDFEGPGVDHVSGGEGDENILAADARVDYIDCGGGTNDFVFFDEGIDRVSPSCENRFPE